MSAGTEWHRLPDGPKRDRLRDEATELLRSLIRNRCVNDGTPDSGGEIRNARLIADYLDGVGLDLEIVEPHPGRGTLIATLPGGGRSGGSGGTGRGLVYLGHTDVVPAGDTGWRVPPFAGELLDGVVWGRGAVDMLGMTATMAVATRRLAETGFRPYADLTMIAVADEEAGGRLGAGWLAAHRPELFRGRDVITEAGGFPIRTTDGPKLECFIGEKGATAATVTVTGRSGHAAFPYASDSAIMRLPEVIERIRGYAPTPIVDDVWRGYLDGLVLEPAVYAGLSTVDRFDETLADLPLGLARHIHAVTRTTLAATVVHGGGKTNVLPDTVEIRLDVRVAPGQAQGDVESAVRGLFDGLDHVTVAFRNWRAGSRSARDTPLWSALEKVCAELMPAARMIPGISAATTDGRHVRPLDATCYGFGLFGERIPADEYFRMYHSTDERVDQESLDYLTRLWLHLARDFG